MQAINGAVVLDQGWDLTSMLAHASQLRGDRVTFRTIPTGRADYRTGSEGVAVKVDPAQVTAFFAGLTAPGAPADPGAGDDADTAAPTPSTAPATTEGRTGRAAAPRVTRPRPPTPSPS
ncbi:hypothetical protein [Pseudonocardia sp. ICBG601]|uniref:hypothetical protein n=1 Tax=Pseudonocardia sp. ICBG601 TaxID=2846759 RepID=UPI001CF63179|nr:hypothetical protein [Pseudonocardia sp. ICBG601]